MKKRKHYYAEESTIKLIAMIAEIEQRTQTSIVNNFLSKCVKEYFKKKGE